MDASSLPELTTELSAISLSGPQAVHAVLFNRDLFLHVTRQCTVPALGALSATCKVLEACVFDRATWCLDGGRQL